MSDLDNQTLTSITPPSPVQGVPVATGELDDLLGLMARLRADCPWDKKQSNHSLIPYAIEEAYELGEAVQSDDDEDIKGELGDVLLQVVFLELQISRNLNKLMVICLTVNLQTKMTF